METRPPDPLKIEAPSTATQWDEVRALLRAFLAWHKDRHRQDLHLIEAYFDPGKFEAELALLPELYAPPRARLLLATLDAAPAGCVGFRELSPGVCEMKRMFVYPRYHGRGVGRALARSIIEAARDSGYTSMRLDTSIRQAEALALYRGLGFVPGAAPPHFSRALRDWLVFMELRLI